MQNDLPIPATTELTEREQEILKLIATGTSNKDIAQQLFISSNTVKVHLRNIFAKIGVTSRTEAAVYAIHAGMTALELAPALEPTLEPALPQVPVAARNRQLFVWVAVAVIILLAGTLAFWIVRSRTPGVAAPTAAPLVPTIAPRWHALSDLPVARSGLALAVNEDLIYAIGGQTSQGVSAVTEQYDLLSEKWTTLAPKPVPVTDISAAAIGGLIYVPGGRLSTGSVTNLLESFDPSRNLWEQHAPLPVALSGYALAAFEGKLYLFGGWDGKNYLSSVYAYDPTLDQWSVRTQMPTPRAFEGAAIAGGQIYVVGGFNGSSALTDNEAYNPNHDSWSKRAALPAGRYGMGMTSLADSIYLVGGQGEPASNFQPLQFSYQQDRWQAFEYPPSQSWLNLGLVSLQTRLYAMGGQSNGQLTSKNLSYQAIYTILVPIIP